MSAILPWWRERLIARFPLHDDMRIEPYNYKPQGGTNTDSWPIRVARQALHLDYCGWWARTQAASYDTPFYAANPDKKPVTASELVFYSTMAPLLYVDGKNHMVKNYQVWQDVRHEGEWVRTKVRRYFIRLAPWQRHADAYRAQTGQEV